MIATKPQPVMSTTSGHVIDGKTRVDVYDRYDLDTPLRKLLELNYGVEAHLSYNLPENQEEIRYRGTGFWYKSRGKHGELEISFDVGCHCERDCCGHMCDLTVTVQQTERHFTIITESRYNY